MNPIGPVNALYPMPTTLVGATVNGKPNFLAVAHVGIIGILLFKEPATAARLVCLGLIVCGIIGLRFTHGP